MGGTSTPTHGTGECHTRAIAIDEVVPVVFVPGIMGSILWRLNPAGNPVEEVWNPDRVRVMGPFALPWNGASWKKQRLITSLGVPVPDFVGTAHRGWANVIDRSYGPIRTFLENELLTPDPSAEGTDALAGVFRLPAYAFGYDWTDDCSRNGERLARTINQILAHEQKALDASASPHAFCERVLILTHSMGGLVTRSACIEHGAGANVLGVVHGVQPTTGSGAAYWRMKAGFPRNGLASYPTAWALGANGEEVTAVMGNMPGALQLLPSTDYTDNTGRSDWLQTGSSAGPQPRSGDPYDDIYLNETDYWRLITKSYLTPEDPTETAERRAWAEYAGMVRSARAFHQRRVPHDRQHDPSYHFFGSSDLHPTADAIRYAVTRTVSAPSDPDDRFVERVGRGLQRGAQRVGRSAREATMRTRHGGWVTHYHDAAGAEYRATLQEADGCGDGTVPVSSGSALQEAPGTRHSRDFPRIEHEAAYKDASVQHYVRGCFQELLVEHLQRRIDALSE